MTLHVTLPSSEAIRAERIRAARGRKLRDLRAELATAKSRAAGGTERIRAARGRKLRDLRAELATAKSRAAGGSRADRRRLKVLATQILCIEVGG